MTILLLVIMPVVMCVIVVKLFLGGNGTILTILFIGLVVLGILALIELLLGISVRRNKIILKKRISFNSLLFFYYNYCYVKINI